MADYDILLLTAPLCLIAGMVRGLTGFGGPLILVPVLGFFYEPTSVVATVMLVDLAANINLLPGAVRQAAWPTVRAITLGALVTLPLGGYTMLHFAPRVIAEVIYGTLGLLSVLLLTGWRYRGPLSRSHLLGAGAVNGLILGATSFGAAMYPVLLAGNESLGRSRANFILWALFCSVTVFIVVLVGGKVGLREVGRALVFAPVYAFGTYAGNRWFHHTSEVTLRHVILVTLIAVSVIGLYR